MRVGGHVGGGGDDGLGGFVFRGAWVGELGRVDGDRPGLPRAQPPADFLQVAPRHAPARVPGHPADGRAGGTGRDEPDADGREQQRGDADGQAPSQADRCAVAGRLFVLPDDAHLAVLTLGDHRGVEVVRGLHLAVEGLHRLVVGEGRGDVVVGRRDDVQHVVLVLGHVLLPGKGVRGRRQPESSGRAADHPLRVNRARTRGDALEPSPEGEAAPVGDGEDVPAHGRRAGRSAMDAMRARGWEARAALALAVLSAVVLLVFADRRGLGLVLLTAAAVAVVLAGGFWFLQQRGPVRWVALALAIAAPVALVVVFIVQHLLWVAVLAVVLLGAAVLAARTALRPDRSAWELPVVDVPDGRRPFVVMNPRSGGGKVARFGLKERAEALGAEVALLDQPHTDVQQLARDALGRGADLLGVAGGDGTQALVAQVAAEQDVPFLVISAGTRNHFALELGLDREDPSRCLDALRDGVEARIDLGEINGRTFVNNASFGAYAEIVENPAYRDDKRRTTLEALPDLLSRRRGAHLVAEVGGSTVDAPQALLVSNNPYEASDLAGVGRRSRLDRGVLGVIAVRVDSAREAVGLLGGAHRRGLRLAEGREVVVTADVPEVPVGIDGETVTLATPVRCTTRPGALRIRLPRERPGVHPPGGRLDWATLWGLAGGRPAAAGGHPGARRRTAAGAEWPTPSPGPGA